MSLFANKPKAFCVEIGEHTVLVAKISQKTVPLVVEEIVRFDREDQEGLQSYLKSVQGKGPTGYAHSICSLYPEQRVIRRQTIDPKRIKDGTYYGELLTSQLRVDKDKYSLQMINPDDGAAYDGALAVKAIQKDVIFAGLQTETIYEHQDRLIGLGIYPEKLELGTVAVLGALADYLEFSQIRSPLLYLEIGEDITQTFIVSANGIEVTRPINEGIGAMIPVVQKELGLKDAESARKLFYSNTFDFTSMGAVLTKRLQKELQASIGYYEVQTGQSIGSVLTTQLPTALGWLGSTLAGGLGVPVCRIELRPWLEYRGVTLAENIDLQPSDEYWLGLFALLVDHHHAVTEDISEQEK